MADIFDITPRAWIREPKSESGECITMDYRRAADWRGSHGVVVTELFLKEAITTALAEQRERLADKTCADREGAQSIVAHLWAGRGRGRTRAKMYTDLAKYLDAIDAAIREQA